MLPTQSIYTIGTEATILYSPWLPRGGDFGKFTLQVPRMSSTSATLIFGVQMYHKNSGDTGNGAAVGSLVEVPATYLATTSQFYFEVTDGFKELVRYTFGLIQPFAGSGTEVNWADFRVLTPVWFSQV